MNRPRAKYAEAGAAMRRAVQRAEVNELTRRDWRVLGAVLVVTASSSRVADFVYVAEVARHAAVKNERQVRASLQVGELAEAFDELTKARVLLGIANSGRE